MIDIKLNNRKVGETNSPLEALEFIVENEKYNSYNPSIYNFVDEHIKEAITDYKDDPEGYQYKFYTGVKEAIENGFTVLDNGNFEYATFKEDSLNAEDLKNILYDAKLTKYSVEENLEKDILEKYTEYLNEEYPDRDFTNETFDLEKLPIGVLYHEDKEEMIGYLFPKSDGIPLSERANEVLESMAETELDIYVNANTMKINDVVDVPKDYFDNLEYPTDANHDFMASYFLEKAIDENFTFESIKERWNTMKEIGAELLSPPQLELFPHKFNPNPNELEITPESLKNMEKEKLKYIERGR